KPDPKTDPKTDAKSDSKAAAKPDAASDAALDDAKRTYGGYLMGIQSYSLRNFPVDRVIEIVHNDLGLSAIEFYQIHLDPKASDEQIKRIKEKTAEVGIKLTSHGVNNFGKNHDANRKLFEFAKKLGLKNITADPSEDSFDSLDKLVEEYDIRIAIHNHGPGAKYSKVADVLGAIKDHHKNIGACADLGHFIRSAEDPVKAINLLEGRLYGIHLKDFVEQTPKAKGCILGQGQLDLEGVFKALAKVKFPADGFLSLEYEEKPNDPIADLQQCLAAAADAAQKVAKATSTN
ncbi:MAG TPA: sugar phosphate isomerase/epimerase, partial [Pirellulales bacterium]